MTGICTTNPRLSPEEAQCCCPAHTHIHSKTPTSQCQSLWVQLAQGPPVRSVLSVIFVLQNWPLDVSSHYPVLGPWEPICRWYAAIHRRRRSCYERRVLMQFRYFGWLHVNTPQRNRRGAGGALITLCNFD